MQLEDIEEEASDKGSQHLKNTNMAPMPVTPRTGQRSQSVPTEGGTPSQKPRRGSHLLAASGIDFEKRRKQMHVSSSTTSESRIFNEGNQWMEEKDGVITKLELIEVKEKMGKMRKAVPTLPLPIAVLLCFINVVLPSFGTFIAAFTLLCGAKCRHEEKSRGFKYGLLAGILQLIFTPILVGWIYSIYYGANIVQDSLTGGSIVPDTQNTNQEPSKDTNEFAISASEPGVTNKQAWI